MRWLIGLTLIVYLLLRFFLSNWSYPGFLWDYGSHLAIAQSLEQGVFFQQPFFPGETTDFMPIYFGLLLSHLLALGIKYVFALPLTTAFLLLTDAAFLIFYFFSLKLFFQSHINSPLKQKLIGASVLTSVCFIFLLPIYGRVVSFGMFSLVTSLLWVGGFIFFYPRKKSLSFLFLLALCLTYPHFFLFLSPVVFLNSKNSLKVRLLLSALWTSLILLYVIKLSNPYGYFEISILPALFHLVVIATSLFKSTRFNKTQINSYFRSQNGMTQINLVYLGLALIFSVLSLVQNGELSYHAQKFLFWAPFGLFLWLVNQNLANWRLGTGLVAFLLTFYHFNKDELELGYKSYLKADSVYNRQVEVELKTLMAPKKCKDLLILPPLSLLKGSFHFQNPVFFIASNSISSYIQPESQRLKSAFLRTYNFNFWNLLLKLNSEPEFVIKELAYKMNQPGSCLIMQNSDYENLQKQMPSQVKFEAHKNWRIFYNEDLE